MKSYSLKKLIKNERWEEIINSFDFEFLISALIYRELIYLAHDLWFHNIRKSEIQEYAVELLFCIRERYTEEWDKDWKNDVYLGNLCFIGCMYNERYQCYLRAYNKISNPPDSLLLLLADCNSAPEQPPIRDIESKKFIQEALKKKITYESALAMKRVCLDENKEEKAEYWENLAQKMNLEGVHTEDIVPDIILKRSKKNTFINKLLDFFRKG